MHTHGQVQTCPDPQLHKQVYTRKVINTNESTEVRWDEPNIKWVLFRLSTGLEIQQCCVSPVGHMIIHLWGHDQCKLLTRHNISPICVCVGQNMQLHLFSVLEGKTILSALATGRFINKWEVSVKTWLIQCVRDVLPIHQLSSYLTVVASSTQTSSNWSTYRDVWG